MNVILDGVAAESAKGARTVAAQIFEKIELLERFPRGAPEDPAAPPFPQAGAKGYRATAGNYEIRYAFPVEYQGDRETVAILLVRDARRDALEVQAIYDRLVQLILEAHDQP